MAKHWDCGWALDECSPSWPTVCALRRTVIRAPETTEPPLARGKQAFELNGGTGTHVDAPSHFIAGGRTIDQLQLNELVDVPLAVVDVSTACSTDPDHQVTQDELTADEELHGRILPGSLVCVRTGWAARHREAETRLREGSPGPWTVYHGKGCEEDMHPDYKLPRMHFPGVSAAAAEWLVQNREMVGLGVDTLSPDAGASEGFKTHHAVLGADRYIVENLNLEGLPARGARVTVAPTALRGAPEAPARVFATLA